MDLLDYNDNELIYLMKSGNESAYYFLIKKYKRFIHGRIYELHLHDHEDCFQEGIVCLYTACMSFDDSFNKSFMKYFEQILNNRLLDLKRSQERESEVMYSSRLNLDNFRAIKEESILLKRDFFVPKSFLMKLTKREKSVFEDYFLNNVAIEDIAKKNNTNKKSIYYTIYRIKGKIKKYMVE